MEINSINEGYVLDHIQAGKSIEIYKYLKLDNVDCQVAMIQNADSKKTGKKDILKIAQKIKLDFNILGYIDPGITVNVIENNKKVDKFNLQLPEMLDNVIFCKNPRCITSVEQELHHIFKLTNKERKIYRCIYCDSKNNG